MGLQGCHRTVACIACAIAVATGVLLWGVGAEAVHFQHYLLGGLLLADAATVTALEALTVWQFLESRLHPAGGAANPPLCALIDTYRRAAVYAVLAVPCFIHLRHVWLPLIPGALLILSAVLYALKHCCYSCKSQRTIVKVPTFVRFKDESASDETRISFSESQGEAAHAAPKAGLSHQSSFDSTHSGSSVQTGSKDSGIEATAAATAAAPQREAAGAAVADAAASSSSKGRKPGRLTRAYSSSPDRCCLINEDSLSLHD